MPLLVENGGNVSCTITRHTGQLNEVLTAAILRDPCDIEPSVSDGSEKKVTFYVTAELNVRCPFLELDTKY